MIRVENVHKSFGAQQIIKGISFEVLPGERLSIIGPGGSGKSILLKLILGLLKPNEGSIHLFDKCLGELSTSEKQSLLGHVGMAFQQGALFDFMTVKDNIMFAIEHMPHASVENPEQKIQELLDEVKLGRTGNMFPYELSGGMQRRVGIARALAVDPKLALFDEPTSGLDPVTSTIILNMISRLSHNDETTMVIATSSVEIAFRFAKRLILINDGKVVADGDWQELLLSDDPWIKTFLGSRLIGLDREYAEELRLPKKFIEMHWS